MTSKTFLLTTIVFSSLLVGASAFADETESSMAPAASDPENNLPGSPAVDTAGATRAYRNPDNGEIEFETTAPVPVRGLSARERNMLNRSDDGLQARALPNGAVAVNLQGRFQSMATIQVYGDTDALQLSCSINDHAIAPELTE
jgi:hypothetical protein